jgi:hypothetical protein
MVQKLTPFKPGTNPKWNKFDLFSDMEKAKMGNIELQKNCDNFLKEHKRIAKKYKKEGGSDSAVRDQVIRYLINNIY